MKRRQFLGELTLASFSIPFLGSCKWTKKEENTLRSMEYRSLSFHGFTQGQILDKDLIKLGAKVGFNNVTIQDDFNIYQYEDSGIRNSFKRDAVNYLTKLKQIFQENGYFEFLREQGLTLSSWIHELDNYDETWGPITLDNDILWRKISERYQKALGEIFPELDYVILTVTESQRWIVQPELLEKLVNIINTQCKRSNMQLILRTFTHNTMQRDGIMSAVERLPDDIIIMTKSVPQDWGMRGINNPVIGQINRKKQYIEACTWGEYSAGQHVANCRIYNEFKPQFDFWNQNDIQGFNVRVTRGNSSVLNNAQEANLWFLGYATSGKSIDPDKALHDFSEEKFGQENAETMAKVLMNTGYVIAEAMYVKDFSFGKTAFRNPIERTTRGVWCKPSLQGWEVVRQEGLKTAEPYVDDEDLYHANPFNYQWDPHHWDKSYYPEYLKVRRGDPQIIREEEEAYQKALSIAEDQLEMLGNVKEKLPIGGYEFFKFKLEENKYVLIFMNEMQLAWLKAERSQYNEREKEIPGLISEIYNHLKNVERMYAELHSEKKQVVWQGREYQMTRFGAYDIPDTLAEFKRFWKL
jgi:hypothetical protein